MTDKMDLRVRARYLAKNEISSADVEKYLAGLVDVADKADFVDYEKRFEEEKANGTFASDKG
jgi:hypothetical protein